ncbi:MAG: NADH-quinone oxidoreductase subunit NuoH [Verrucomicrobia bacterium]|nr:NADH-quinone oxidoreductase subunit NuoH [Verrucomicrobiota bacterium]
MDWLNQQSPTQQFALFSAVKVAAAVGIAMFLVAYTVYVERKVCAFIQDRVGPNRVGPFGLLQPMADGIKAFLKEDFVPGHVRRAYFWLAPFIALLPGLITLAVIPFGSNLGGQKMVIADLNVGVLFTFGIVSLGVYSIILAGYAANSKYPFLSGIRAGGQMISYELSMGLSVIPLLMLVGSLNLGDVIAYQSQGLFGWLIFKQPLAFAIFLAAAFAETNRLPFDVVEAEQELAGGYNVEYSSIKFALFFMGEYANMIASSAMMVTLFFGGWMLPCFGLDQPATSLVAGLAHIVIFLGKTILLVVMFVWVRWMWPRFRYDQLMNLGWRGLLPLALANIVVTAAWLSAMLWWRSSP